MKLTVCPGTRKPVTTLTPGDLEAYPVWEFALDEETAPGQDETWVRPIDSRAVPPGSCSILVATEFRTASGQSYPGFSIVSTGRGRVEIEPAILLAGGSYLPADDPQGWLSYTGPTDAEIYPVTFELRVPVHGERECRGGRLLGT